MSRPTAEELEKLKSDTIRKLNEVFENITPGQLLLSHIQRIYDILDETKGKLKDELNNITIKGQDGSLLSHIITYENPSSSSKDINDHIFSFLVEPNLNPVATLVKNSRGHDALHMVIDRLMINDKFLDAACSIIEQMSKLSLESDFKSYFPKKVRENANVKKLIDKVGDKINLPEEKKEKKEPVEPTPVAPEPTPFPKAETKKKPDKELLKKFKEVNDILTGAKTGLLGKLSTSKIESKKMVADKHGLNGKDIEKIHAILVKTSYLPEFDDIAPEGMSSPLIIRIVHNMKSDVKTIDAFKNILSLTSPSRLLAKDFIGRDAFAVAVDRASTDKDFIPVASQIASKMMTSKTEVDFEEYFKVGLTQQNENIIELSTKVFQDQNLRNQEKDRENRVKTSGGGTASSFASQFQPPKNEGKTK